MGVFVYWVIGNPLTSAQFMMAERQGCGNEDTNNARIGMETRLLSNKETGKYKS